MARVIVLRSDLRGFTSFCSLRKRKSFRKIPLSTLNFFAAPIVINSRRAVSDLEEDAYVLSRFIGWVDWC